jgi:RND superfamily putative drug exporter
MENREQIKGIAARAALWSARHRALAILGWIAFVIGVTVLSGHFGTLEATSSDQGHGDSGQADRIVEAAGFPEQPAGEMVIVQNRAGTEAILAPEPLAVGDGLGVAVRVPTCPEPPAAGRELSAAAAQAFEATLSDALVLASALPRVAGLDADDVITWGEGLGAGLALAVAALTGARAACALNPLPAALGEASARCDVALVARGLACPVLMGSCGLDLQASPLAQDAVAAGLQDVRRIVYPRYGHERVNAFEDEMLSFLVSLEGGRP